MIRATLLSLSLVCLSTSIASADPSNPPVDTGADDRGFWGATTEDAPAPAPQSGGRNHEPAESPNAGPQIVLGESACDGAETVVANGSLDAAGFCAGAEREPETVTVGDVRNAFARLDLPAATLVIQPPDGLTLVNFDTNFYTTSTRPITRTVTLLGQRVTIEATPAEFHWSFGDGGAVTTTDPGAPYPDLTVTHNYLQTGTYRPSLATTFTGRFRVGGGAWQQIPGTVTIDGNGQAVRAIEAQPKLVGY